MKRFSGWLLLLFGCFIASNALAGGQDEIRQAFGLLQKAIKARDTDKIWDLIDTDSQTDANKSAKAVQKAYDKTDARAKVDFEKKYGLTSKELSDMTGKLFIKSSRFHAKYYEVPDSKIESISVKGDTARLGYIEEDGDKLKLSLVKQKGQWRFTLPMPKAVN